MLKLHLKVEGGSLSSGPRSFSVFLQLQRWTGGTKAAKQPRGQLMTNSCGGRTTGHSLADCWTILRLFYVFYVISWLTFCWFLTQQSSSFKRRNAAPPAQCFPYAPSAPASHTHTFCHLFGVFLNFTFWREGWNIFIWENKRSHWLRQVHELGEQTCTWSMCRSNWV